MFDAYVFAAADWATVDLKGWVTQTQALVLLERHGGPWVFESDLLPMDSMTEEAFREFAVVVHR
jgi:hypothetical protein